MVVRCSNGVAFLVLEPEPSVRTGIRVDIFRGDDPATLIATLPDTWGRRWTDPLKGPGSGEFWLHASNPKLAENPDLLAYGNVARFSLDEVYRFAIQIEHLDRVQAKAGGDVQRTIHVTGRGGLSKLEDATIYPEGGLAGDSARPFTDANAGEILSTFIAEAKARGALVGVTEDYTDALTSNNVPYLRTLTLEERAGNSILRVAERLQDLAVDIYATPALELKLVNERGVDHSQQLPNAGPVILEFADNLVELTRSEDGAIRNLLLIETPAGFLERSQGGSISTHGRREAFLSLGNIIDGDAVDRAAESVFAQSADPAAEIGLEVVDKDGARPYVDWQTGDWVLAPDEDDQLERHRVRALTVSETKEGRPVFVPELATITEELENRVERWLAAMAKGTMGGTAGSIAEPVKAPTEVVEAIDAGIGDHIAGQPHFDELADLADVDAAGWEEGDVLRYDGADWIRVTGAKDPGHVLTIQADGNPQWDDPPGGGGGGGGWTLIEEIVRATAGGFLFENIPVGEELRLVVIGRLSASGTGFGTPNMRVGGSGGIDTGSNYAFRSDDHVGTSTSFAATSMNIVRGCLPQNDNPAGASGMFTVWMPKYADTTFWRNFTAVGGGAHASASETRRTRGYGTWKNASDPIEKAEIINSMAVGSVARLYVV